ncbi:iron export ABC transporter permease subunit FetB [Saccharopolyspora sp. K220]|uniref:ABC transporter permease n=1 Tax=Saccharopolyspora soli TaxID=2926618 RepID=UPI001F56394A|nr:iron export ABC transporter permease subunit FetB [Saccharopolyspora soli]MCI2419776.1 iron export ABC transporter permease subunit FetB [Saccharopolyspora soli]
MTGLTVPTWTAVAASLLLVALTAALALRHRLHLTKELVVASVRAGVQLIAVGAVLVALFEYAGLPGALGWIAFMVALGGQVAGYRGRGLPWARTTATAGVATASTITLGSLVALGAISPQPRILVPIGGMIVSGAMQATAVALRRIREQAQSSRPAIEARLSLGLSAREAFLPFQRSALRTALLPAIDSTKVVGLISLPGAMTGLILAGVDPLTAIRYQIIVMYMLLAATTIAALTATRLAERALFDSAHRLAPLTTG